MNGLSARAAMTGNKKGGLALLVVLSFCLAPLAAQAEGSAPALLGIQEILVKQPKLGDDASSDICGLSANDMSDLILKKLKEDGAPAYSALEAPAIQTGTTSRIDLSPEVVTLERQGFDCTSWISLTAQSRETLTIVPVRVPRSVYVTYWRGGLIVSSTQTSHRRAVNDALGKLAVQFSRQYRNDQPPPLPDFGD